MHQDALDWVAAHAVPAERVVDIGGRDINGSPRRLFGDATYTVVDLLAAPNVDVVADVCLWKPKHLFDVAVCCEVLEHTDKWREILAAAARLTRKGGLLIVTAAGPGREPHSALDGGEPRPDEHYANIDPDDLADALTSWKDVTVDVKGPDVRAVATR